MATDSTNRLGSDELAEVFVAAPEEFVAARDALAKRLRQEGREEDAARVRKLRKPTNAAWLVNQLSRHAEGELRRWLDLVDRLGDASGEELRKGAHEADSALADLVIRAGAIADDLRRPATEATLTKVRETLDAAAIEPEVRELVAEGRIDRERRAASVGFGTLAAIPERSQAKGGGGKRKPTAAARKALAQAKRELKSAEKAEARASSAVETLTAKLAAARDDRDAAAAALKEARRKLSKAERAAR